MKGRILDHRDGIQVQVHYAVSPGGFIWEKHSDHHPTEQASSIPGGWALSFHNENGGVRSRVECNKKHHLQRVEYYAPDSEVQESSSMVTEHSDELVWAHRQEDGEQTKTVLYAYPIQMGTAEQVMIDPEAGEPQILTMRLSSDFCYCAGEEYRQRTELQDRLSSGVIPSIPVFIPDKPSPEPMAAQKEERMRGEESPLILLQPQETTVPDLMEQT